MKTGDPLASIRRAACMLAQLGYGAAIIDWPWSWFVAACETSSRR
jgi:hypothetical protein